MKRTVFLALLALAFSAVLCVTGTCSVNRAVRRVEALRIQAEQAARAGDLETAAAQLRTMAGDWRRREKVLELVTAHDALSDVQGAIADALICLENGERVEFYRSSAALGAALERMGVTESVRFMNLF